MKSTRFKLGEIPGKRLSSEELTVADTSGLFLERQQQRTDCRTVCDEESASFDLQSYDSGRLRQIITNLLTNAFKFTEAGFIHVEIFVDSLKDGLVMLHIVVADSGIGIPEDRTTDIFKLFEQIDSSATRKFGGVGLGLAICSRLVELMEGRIWVESQPGFGSEFRPGSYVMLRSQANGQAECTCIPISQLPLPDRVPFEVQRRSVRREWPESCRVADSDRTRLSHHSQDKFVERNGRG